MNIFAVDYDPWAAAAQLCDQYVIKMPLESRQLLSTAQRELDGVPTSCYVWRGNKRVQKVIKVLPDDKLVTDSEGYLMFERGSVYMSTHVNHPSAIWVRESSDNYQWLYTHMVALSVHYQSRFNRVHKCMLNNDIIMNTPTNVHQGRLTRFRLAMPDKYKQHDATASYRDYLNGEKQSFSLGDKPRWTNSKRPKWW